MEENTKQKISILGCGWLGFPLAKKLIETGYEIKGSTTSESKLDVLKSNQIEPFLIKLEEHQVIGSISEFVNDTEILIIDIPPGLRKVTEFSTEKTFVNKIKTLLPFIENSTIEKVIFISSTSVYGESNLIPILIEESDLFPETESGKQLVEVENLFRNNKKFKTTILRFGGLIGEDRNAVKMLSGKTDVANPEAPINLIHQEDCIGIISEILKQEYWNETLNAASPFHPTRKDYYTKKALELNLPIPHFDEKDKSSGKIISSEKLEKILGYKFLNLELK